MKKQGVPKGTAIGRRKYNLPYTRLRIECMWTEPGTGVTKQLASTSFSVSWVELTFRKMVYLFCDAFGVPIPKDTREALQKVDTFLANMEPDRKLAEQLTLKFEDIHKSRSHKKRKTS